jgi:uncharacterized protein involved in exopolysaccharide biosynthesis
MNSRGPRTFERCLRAARRRKLLIAAPALVLVVSSGFALSKLPSLYQSSARMLVLESKSDATTELRSYFENCRQLVANSDIPQARGDSNRRSLIAQRTLTHDRVSIEPDISSSARPGTFVVSYTAVDPETARSVATEVANMLVSQSAKGATPAAGKLEPLRVRATELSNRVRELEQTYPWLTDGRSQRPSSSSPEPPRSAQPSAEAIRAQQMTIESLNDQQYKFQQQLNDVERRIASQRQLVEQQKKSGLLRNNPTYAVLISKRTELQGQRDTLINRQELTDKHPRVAAISDQIAAIDRQIDELRQQDVGLVSQSPEARELASLESERNRLKLDLEVTGRELARRTANQTYQPATTERTTPSRDRTDSKLMQDYLALKRSNDEVATELQDAEAKAKAADAHWLPVRILDEATLPTRPVGPNRTLLTSLVAVLGLMLGLILALIAESGRLKSLQDAADVECYARLPLLASIPKTGTSSDRRRALWIGAAKLAAATALSVAATFALSQFLLASHIFDLIAKK